MIPMIGKRARSAAGLHRRGQAPIGAGLLIASLLPVAILLLVQPTTTRTLVELTAAGTLGAAMLGYLLLRNLTIFPAIRASFYIIPTFLVGYSTALAVFFFLRLEYSRPVFLGSFVLSVAWCHSAHRRAARARELKLGVVPFGKARTIEDLPGVAWKVLAIPRVEGRLDGLIADFRADMPAEWESFIAEQAVAGMPVFHHKQLSEMLTGKVEIEHLSENGFGSLVPFAAYLHIKRVIDIVVAASALVMLCPLLLVVAGAIKLDSPGPILFRQQRVGYRGKPFRVTKFRTMRHGPMRIADRDSAVTVWHDPRVTRVGRHLRRTRVDELPQLWNVLRGEMSLIGPRPEMEILSDWYAAELPFYRYRHIVPPGISGWAQVNQGHVADLAEVHSKLHYDFYYIKHFSPWLDALILLRTIRTIITGFGSK